MISAAMEIADVLGSDPSVLEAAVIGVPDDKWGEVVVAYVQPRPNSTVDPTASRPFAANSSPATNVRPRTSSSSPSPRAR